jgi:hypothetical protein
MWPMPGRSLPANITRPAVLQLRMHANNVVCWSNDIQSLVVEARQPGQFRNMVTIYASQGHALQEAVDITARRVRAEIDSFASQAAQVGKRAGAPLRGYLTGMKDWMRGYQDWFDHDTRRYAAGRAEHEADDRDRRLPSASPVISSRPSSDESCGP